MTISSIFIKEQQEGNAKVDVLFIMMEKVQEGFCEELMKLANQYGYKLNKAAYRTMDILAEIPCYHLVYMDFEGCFFHLAAGYFIIGSSYRKQIRKGG